MIWGIALPHTIVRVLLLIITLGSPPIKGRRDKRKAPWKNNLNRSDYSEPYGNHNRRRDCFNERRDSFDIPVTNRFDPLRGQEDEDIGDRFIDWQPQRSNTNNNYPKGTYHHNNPYPPSLESITHHKEETGLSGLGRPEGFQNI